MIVIIILPGESDAYLSVYVNLFSYISLDNTLGYYSLKFCRLYLLILQAKTVMYTKTITKFVFYLNVYMTSYKNIILVKLGAE